MTSFFNTMPMAQSRRPLQFIPYTKPPDAKLAPRRVQLKTIPPSDDEHHDINDFLIMEPGWNTEGGNREELACTMHAVGAVDLTCSVNNEVKYKLNSSRRGILNVSSDDTTNDQEDVSIPITQEAIQLPPSTGSSEEDAIVINNSDDDCEAKGDDKTTKRNDDCFHHQQHRSRTYEQIGPAREGLFMKCESLNQGSTAEGSTPEVTFDNDDSQAFTTIDGDDDGGNRSVPGIGSQGQENLIAVIPKSPLEECSIGPHDVISSESDESRADRTVGVPQQGLGFAPRARAVSKSFYLTSSDGEAQDVVPSSSSLFITEARPRKIERVVDQSESLAFKIESRVGNSPSESDSNHKGHDAQVVRKRKRGASVCAITNKRRSRTSNKTLKLRPTAVTDATKQQKQLHYLRRSQIAQPATCIPKLRQGDDTSAEDSSDNTENRHNSRSAKVENIKKAYELDFECGSSSEDAEYEVDRILAVRLHHGNLQYHVLWVGYEADSNWYNASNFKNSPRKLREFHKAEPTKPGPPARLSHWEQCWEEDRDADDFQDNDQPERTTRRGPTVRSRQPGT